MERDKPEALPVALTISDAARRLAVSPMTIRRLLACGVVTRITVGRSVRVLARSVDELAERGGCRVPSDTNTPTTTPLLVDPREAGRLPADGVNADELAARLRRYATDLDERRRSATDTLRLLAWIAAVTEGGAR